MAPPREPDSSSKKQPSLARRFYTRVKNSVLAGVRGAVKPVKTVVDVFLQALQKFQTLLSGKSLNSRKAIANPKTVKDFKQNLDIIVHESGLGKLYPPDHPYLHEVAARAVKLKDDPNNPLNSPEQIGTLTRLALYQPVLYCDDSGSMSLDSAIAGCTRLQALQKLVTQIISIATRAVPDNKGVHLRFINRSDGYNNLNTDDLPKVRFSAGGYTPLGTSLRGNVLTPFLYDIIDSNKPLPHPLLILTITDGCPNDESTDEFRNEIARCGQYLVDKEYPKEAVSFDLSQVGNDYSATQFLQGLMQDDRVKDVLHCTAEHLDAKFEEFRNNGPKLEGWLLEMLSKKITLKEKTS